MSDLDLQCSHMSHKSTLGLYGLNTQYVQESCIVHKSEESADICMKVMCHFLTERPVFARYSGQNSSDNLNVYCVQIRCTLYYHSLGVQIRSHFSTILKQCFAHSLLNRDVH